MLGDQLPTKCAKVRLAISGDVSHSVLMWILISSPCTIAGWVVGSSNATITSAHRHYAQRYRHLAAQRRRSQEEQNILLTEVILSFNWLEERETDMETRMEELRASIGTRGSNAGTEEPDMPGSSSTIVPGLAGNGAGAWRGCNARD